MDELDYNTCNATFRSLTDQQRLMVEETSRLIGADADLELTSYGCGFGMFELELIARVPRGTVWFQGVDTNGEAVERLRATLAELPKVRGHRVLTASMADVADLRITPTEYGLFVQSLCYLGADEGMAVLKEARNRHRRLVVAVPPLNRLNGPFAESLARQGIERPLFARTLAEELTRFGVEFRSATVGAEITVPVSEPAHRLLEFLTFARHQPWRGGTGRAELLDAVAGMGTVSAGCVRIPHPVEVFSIG
ncbi:class I SAM-dependent methyltransferase [Amycolatopsis japonica]|uniref:class I SAM-dependent methyltransferase n=1 Tax=Amycolatopsis japonica TaxID=208439 RepID=UPI00331CB1ED